MPLVTLVEGFGGKRAHNGALYLSPDIPKQWDEYAFRIKFKGNDLEVRVTAKEVEIISHADNALSLYLYNNKITLEPKANYLITRN